MITDYIQVYWPELVYAEPTDGTAELRINQVHRAGVLMNTAYCPVSQKWNLLVAGDDGKFHNLTHDDDNVSLAWVGEHIDD